MKFCRSLAILILALLPVAGCIRPYNPVRLCLSVDGANVEINMLPKGARGPRARIRQDGRTLTFKDMAMSSDWSYAGWPCMYSAPLFLTGDDGSAHLVISLSWFCGGETKATIDLTGVPQEIHGTTSFDRCE